MRLTVVGNELELVASLDLSKVTARGSVGDVLHAGMRRISRLASAWSAAVKDLWRAQDLAVVNDVDVSATIYPHYQL